MDGLMSFDHFEGLTTFQERVQKRISEQKARLKQSGTNRKNARRARLAKFNLTEDQYQRILYGQGGVCAICRRSYPTYSIDHDHKCCSAKGVSCGRCVRGLLCVSCNMGIGSLGDDPERLRSAAVYLSRSRQDLS